MTTAKSPTSDLAQHVRSRGWRRLHGVTTIAAALLMPLPVDGQEALPPDIVEAIRTDYVVEGMVTRYLDATVDLNGDGAREWVVHVVGPAACGSGGCPTLVFTPAGEGYRLVSAITVSRPPIAVSSASTRGWHNLLVHVSGGGQRGRDVELLFDGKRYPQNPSVAGAQVRAAAPGGAVLIPEFKDFSEAKPLP